MVKEKSISELKSRLENQEDFILLDVRTDNEVLVSKITEDFIQIPMNEIPSKLSKSIIIKKLLFIANLELDLQKFVNIS